MPLCKLGSANTPLAKGQTRPGLYLRVNLHGYQIPLPWILWKLLPRTGGGGGNPSLCLSFFPLDLISWFPPSHFSPGTLRPQLRRGCETREWGAGRDQGRRAAPGSPRPQKSPEGGDATPASAQSRFRRGRGGCAAAARRGEQRQGRGSPARRRRPQRRELVPTRVRRPPRPLSLARGRGAGSSQARRAASAEAFARLSTARPGARPLGSPGRGVCERARGRREALNLAGAAACSRGGLGISHPLQSGNIFIVIIHSSQSESQTGGQRHPGDLPGGQTDRATVPRTECRAGEKGW